VAQERFGLGFKRTSWKNTRGRKVGANHPRKKEGFAKGKGWGKALIRGGGLWWVTKGEGRGLREELAKDQKGEKVFPQSNRSGEAIRTLFVQLIEC